MMGVPVLAVGIVGVIWLMNNPANPEYVPVLYPIVSGMYLTVLPFFTALYQAFKLLNKKGASLSDMRLFNGISFCS